MKLSEIFDRVKKSRRNNLTELESREVLEYYNIPVVKGEIVKSIESAKQFIEKIHYPVALKVVSKQIIHKTDVGGVMLNIRNEKELIDGYHEIVKNIEKNISNATIEGIFVQEMLSGTEVIIGGKKDPTFGQTIAFGLGGIFVEIYKDISFRVVPISKNDALKMIKDIKAYKILEAYRGSKPANIDALVDMLLKTSRLLEENHEIKELDINPVFAMPDGAVAADARIIIE